MKRELSIAGALLIWTCSGYAQGALFGYDPSGDLLMETNESPGLPIIVGLTQVQVVQPGKVASFLVLAADSFGVSYQWFFNGTNLPGAASDALLVPNVSTANQGPYFVVLSKGSGSVTSSVVQLYIDTRGVGMPDSWQLAYFGNLTNNATGDQDGDGVSNLQEFLDGTNPTNSASARFRLTVLSNGGTVQTVPLQGSYTNGQVVTLSATAFSPDIFRGWAGAINTISNPATLTITNNATVFAYLGPSYVVWTNPAGGDWNVATNWNPNIVPGFDDTVIIDGNLTVTVNTNTECGNLTLGSSVNTPMLSGGGTLSLLGNSTWLSGTMNGGGRTVIAPGASIIFANPSTLSLNNRVLENGGTISWVGADSSGAIGLINAVITNRPGAFFQARTSSLIVNQGGAARFDNAGTFSKSAGAGITTLGCLFNNFGTVDIQTGTLALQSGGTNSGTITVSAGTTLNSAGTFLSDPTSSITSPGNFTVSSGSASITGLINLSGTLTVSGGTVNFDGPGTVSPAVVNLSGGTLGGADLLTVGTLMNWTGGAAMSGSGRTVISPGAILNMAGAFTLSLASRTLENGGTILWTGAGGLYLADAVITNRAGALFEARNDASFNYQGGVTRFDNAGIFRKSVTTGNTTFNGNIPFNNYGTVDIRGGIIVANGGYVSSSGAVLNCTLGGLTAGIGYGQLQVAGAVTLSGALSMGLVNGYGPATNDSFTVLTAGTRNGTFASFSYPSNQVTMLLSNTTSAVIVRVTGVAPPQPLLLPPLLSGTNVLLTWTAVSNLTYRLEFNPDLNQSNWNALSGDVLGVSNTASKQDTLTSSNRLYRVRVLP